MDNKNERIKLTKDDAIRLALSIVNKLTQDTRKMKFASRDEVIMLHDALAFALFELGAEHKEVPELWARYSVDGNFEENKAMKKGFTDDEWKAPDEEETVDAIDEAVNSEEDINEVAEELFGDETKKTSEEVYNDFMNSL
jgi:hypothetical protein